MKTIGQIAYLILTKCPEEAIAASLCNCLDKLFLELLISQEESTLFSAVISGWQAVGHARLHDHYIRTRKENGNPDIITFINNRRVQENFSIYIREDYEKKRQWLINLACMRS
jgi:hypothetical protein